MKFWILLVGVFFLSLRLSAQCDSLYTNPVELRDPKILNIQDAYKLKTPQDFYAYADSLTKELKRIRLTRIEASVKGQKYNDVCPKLTKVDHTILDYINSLYNGASLLYIGYGPNYMSLTRNLKILSYFITQWRFLSGAIKTEIIQGWKIYIDYIKVEYLVGEEFYAEVQKGNFVDVGFTKEEALRLLSLDNNSTLGKLMWDYNQLMACFYDRYSGLLVPFGTPEPPDYEPKYFF